MRETVEAITQDFMGHNDMGGRVILNVTMREDGEAWVRASASGSALAELSLTLTPDVVANLVKLLTHYKAQP